MRGLAFAPHLEHSWVVPPAGSTDVQDAGRLAKMGCVSDDPATYLDAVDERLVGFLADDGDLSSETVWRLQRFAVALSEGSMTPALALQDWADFYPLAAAFVVVHGSDELRGLYDQATVFSAVVGRDVQFTDADRVFLVALSEELEGYARAHRP